jgi:TetR/AcrR family transcriptional repressor of bet genes
LIDACISALHIHGPSRTTVEKVVAIAKMSPGIVRFYFDSKAAMLVASLQFLAAEFEERLLVPVARLKETPVAALELLIQLYLDPDIASSRKVSVWYAFWGEANSRQEYYDICGQKDEGFAALVRELIGRLIIETSQPQLDPDGIALGLIGVLEMLWQDFAFQTEETIDRAAAHRRCRAYLRSIFPTRFAAVSGAGIGSGGVAGRGAGTDSTHLQERALLLQRAWTVVGHESQCLHAGDFLTVDIGIERVLLLRDGAGRLQGLRNACPESPHALVTRRSGRFAGDIVCALHGQRFSWDGRPTQGAGVTHLHPFELGLAAGLIYARAAVGPTVARSQQASLPVWFDADTSVGLTPCGEPLELLVAADWKVVIELWLTMARRPSSGPIEMSGSMENDCAVAWHAWPLRAAGWSGRRYAKVMRCTAEYPWRCQFLPPNQLLEWRPDGLSVLQVFTVGAARCRVRRLDFTVLAADDTARAVSFLAQRLGAYARRTTRDVAESIQGGLVECGYAAENNAASAPLVAWFRAWYGARILRGAAPS